MTGSPSFAGPRIDLWARADLSGGPASCWPWAGARNNNGYGRVRFSGRSWYAHRVAFILGVGPLGRGLMVCHSCDNPPCVNPAHLFAGTVSDNHRDMVAKGRQWRRVPIAAVSDLRDATPQLIAGSLGVSVRTVYRRLAELRRTERVEVLR